MENANYETQMLDSNLFKIFTGVYNDFRVKAREDYMFELTASTKSSYSKGSSSNI